MENKIKDTVGRLIKAMNNYELKIIISSRNEPTLSTGFNRQWV
jgi:hypothetical protein